MKACVDVHYLDSVAAAACVLFEDWSDANAAAEYTTLVTDVAAYESGHFFRRELPCILAVLQQVLMPLEVIIVDGYVWLGENERGLGAHLFEALDQKVPVIGVAKKRFLRATTAREVIRGDSHVPLFITAAGIDPDVAADRIRSMHGPFRIPTLLKRVDQLCRSVVANASRKS